MRAAVHRIACAVVAAELRRIREADLPEPRQGEWPETLPIGEAGLGLDSLEQLGALGALSETFGLDDGVPNRAPPDTVGDWIDWIMAGRGSNGGRITVMTSGSTGVPRACVHGVAELLDEAAFWAAQCPDPHRVVALVPAHHLYGMIWTALLPAMLDIPVCVGAVGMSPGLQTGDLVVAVPEQWQALLRLTRRFPQGVVGVSSAGSLDDELAAALLGAGLTRLIDVYGASETGAIAMRTEPAAPYELLPRWRLQPRGEDDWQLVDREGAITELPDQIDRIGKRSLRPTGRRDGALQVGGHNVWPERIAQMLRETAGVADAAVRLHVTGRLKAFIVPQPGSDTVALALCLERVVETRLPGYARPKSFRFGPVLPRNPMGKLCDWA